MKYWVHENRHNNYVVIHEESCTNCNYGRGLHGGVYANPRSGQWCGPYESQQEAFVKAESTCRPLDSCSRCSQ